MLSPNGLPRLNLLSNKQESLSKFSLKKASGFLAISS